MPASTHLCGAQGTSQRDATPGAPSNVSHQLVAEQRPPSKRCAHATEGTHFGRMGKGVRSSQPPKFQISAIIGLTGETGEATAPHLGLLWGSQ